MLRGLVRPVRGRHADSLRDRPFGLQERERALHSRASQPVRAVLVTFSAATDTRSYTGTIEPRYESHLGCVSGKIVERLVNIGDEVTHGMTLELPDSTDYRLSSSPPEPRSRSAQRAKAGRSRREAQRRPSMRRAGSATQATIRRKLPRTKRADAPSGCCRLRSRATSLPIRSVVTETGAVTALPVDVGQVVSAGPTDCARGARLDELEAVGRFRKAASTAIASRRRQ